MSITKQKINNIVGAGKGADEPDNRPFRAEELFKRGWGNVFLCAKKHSGKTTVLQFILKKIMSSETKLLIFASTVNIDPIWKEIVERYTKKKVDVEAHTSIFDDNGNNLIEDLILLEQHEAKEKLKIEKADRERKEKAKQAGVDVAQFGSGLVKLPEHKEVGTGQRKGKYRERKTIVVLDDLGLELHSKPLTRLIKESRHWHMQVFVSSQFYTDLKHDGRQQIDYYLLFAGITPKYLEMIWNEGAPPMKIEEFLRLYREATSTEFSFFYFGCRDNDYRENFNTRLTFTETAPKPSDK